MSLFDDNAKIVLANCGRCCCLCRRFLPIRLQVHHIVERQESGDDELDNLIALCVTCHIDVHTKAPFTRRFTVEELKLHRDAVYRLVNEGKLPAGSDVGMDYALARAVRQAEAGAGELSPAAVELLLAAASGDGTIIRTRTSCGECYSVGDRSFGEPKNHRIQAEYRDALKQLTAQGLTENMSDKGVTFELSHKGYVLADELLAEGGQPDKQ